MADPIPLYRFLDSHGALKTLEAGRFRVGLVSNFNDPFEWRLGFTGAATPDQQKSVESFNSERQRWSETWMGVLCFSDSFSAPVLWSLYADKHNGVAFEVKYPWPDDHLVKMTYFPERPVMDFSRLREFGGDEEARNRYLLDLLARLMRNKSPGFIFEMSPVTSKPASWGRIKTSHSKVVWFISDRLTRARGFSTTSN